MQKCSTQDNSCAHLRLVLEEPRDAASRERPLRGRRQRLVRLPVLGLPRRQLLKVDRLPLIRLPFLRKDMRQPVISSFCGCWGLVVHHRLQSVMVSLLRLVRHSMQEGLVCNMAAGRAVCNMACCTTRHRPAGAAGTRPCTCAACWCRAGASCAPAVHTAAFVTAENAVGVASRAQHNATMASSWHPSAS
jgi:hypothetical protein